jgi:hypothetical protein
MRTYIHPDVVDEMTKEFIKHVNATRPDTIKADYERVMRESGLLPSEPKLWLPKDIQC